MGKLTLFSNWLLRGLGRTSKKERRKLKSRMPRGLKFESVEQRQLLSSVAIWTGAGTTNNFSTAANWQGNVVPQAGAQLIFQGTARTSPNNNLAAGTSFASIEFEGSGFNLKGNSITLGSNNTPGTITVDSTASAAAISLNLQLAGTTSVTINGGPLTVSGNMSDATGSSGSLSESGGTLTLSGTNTYSGSTAINAGKLVASGTTALSSNSALIVGAGAALSLSSNETVGSLSGSSSGSVTLASHTLTVNNASPCSFPGTISGTGGLTEMGSATLTLGGINTNFTGTMTIDSGTVALSGGAALADSKVVLANATTGATLSLLDNETIGSLIGGGTSGGNVVLNGNTLTVNDNSNCTFAGTIGAAGGDTGGLTAEGTATLTGSNVYTGPTTVSTGTLQLGDGSTANGDVAGNIVLANTAAALTFANPNPDWYAGNISGSGTVTINGPGVEMLGGNTTDNTYSGQTAISSGTLEAIGQNAIPNASVVSLADTSAAELLLGNSIIIGSLAGGGIVNLGSYTLTVGNNTVKSFSGVIEGSGGLVKQGTGTESLNGADTYTGPTIVEAGTLVIGNSQGIPSSSAVTLETGTRLNLSASAAIGSLSDGGTSGGLLWLSTYTLVVNGDNTSPTSFSGNITGSGGLTKTGPGTLTLNGDDTNSLLIRGGKK